MMHFRDFSIHIIDVENENTTKHDQTSPQTIDTNIAPSCA